LDLITGRNPLDLKNKGYAGYIGIEGGKNKIVKLVKDIRSMPVMENPVKVGVLFSIYVKKIILK